MRFANEGGWDRAIRLLGGSAAIFAGGGSVSDGLGGALLTLGGLVAFVTGIGGWCPMYTVCGISTASGEPTGCRQCDTARRP